MKNIWVVRFLQLGALVLIIMGLFSLQYIHILAGIGVGILALVEFRICQADEYELQNKGKCPPNDERG